MRRTHLTRSFLSKTDASMSDYKLQSPIARKPPPWDADGLSHQTRLELLEFESQELKHIIEQREHNNWRIESWLRFILTCLASGATWWWILFVTEQIRKQPAPMNEHVLIALMTTTTANILGVWAIVARYVWHVKEKPKESKPKKRKGRASDSDDDDKPNQK